MVSAQSIAGSPRSGRCDPTPGDVPLRRRPLRQPGGLEGFLGGSKASKPDAFPISKLGDLHEGLSDRSAADSAACVGFVDRQDEIPVVLDALAVKVKQLKRLIGRGQELADTLLASVRGIGHTRQHWTELDATVKHVHHALHAALIEGFDPPTKRLHVLPRHRLLPQPHGFEGCAAVEVEDDLRHLVAADGE